MRSYSLIELFCLTRTELFALHAEIASVIAGLPDDAADRPILLDTLRNIRWVLAGARPSPLPL